MTTLVQQYIEGVRAALRASQSLPGEVEDSPVRAHTRDATAVVTVLPGREQVTQGATQCATRLREIHLVVHSAGDDHLALCEDLFEAAHPIVMAFRADNLVAVAELGTDEPRYANGDLTRQVVARRYLFTYQTDEHSLSE